MKKLMFGLALFLFMLNCDGVKDGNVLFIDENPVKGFNYPYFLFMPEKMAQEGELRLIVEPNNSGFVDDNLQKHIDKAKRTATIDYYLGNYVARKLQYPLLVPVFPRSKTDWKIYTHALDRDVMAQKGNDLERIDLQLLAMIENAREKLLNQGYNIKNNFLMTGFSASGTFVNRFTLIHPDRVFAVAAGGLNGLLALPIGEMKGSRLNYPLGTYDFQEFLGKKFDSIAFKNTPQYLFMGKLDENDAIPYDDGYNNKERDLIYKLLGKEMQPQRWKGCKEIYKQHQVNALIKTYPGIGHEHPAKVKEDVVEFFKDYINIR
jgi:hypothetical protein